MLAISVNTYLVSIRRAVDQQRRAQHDVTACLLAEAGVNWAAANLSEHPSAYSGDKDISLGEGRFTVAVVSTSDPAVYRVTSIGQLAEDGQILAKCEINALVIRRPNGYVTVHPAGREGHLAGDAIQAPP